MQFIDTHAHIYLPEFKPDREEMIIRANQASVSRIYMPNIDHRTTDEMLELEANYPQMCFAMMGLHPSSVKKDFEKELYQVENWLAKRPFAGIGECGIDLYWDKTFFEQQKEALRIQIQLAKKYKLPIILHTRDAFTETFALIEAENDNSLTGVFHCFSGTVAEAEKVKSLGGFYLGIGGVATYKNGGLTPMLEQVELDWLVFETDSPYLSPVPYRGKRNEPAYLVNVAQKIAEIKNIPVLEVAEKTTKNALALFGKKAEV